MKEIQKLINTYRKDYVNHELDESHIEPNPFRQFEKWLEEVVKANAGEPNTMSFATCGPEGRPTIRVVLLRGFDDKGFVFYTNYNSRKGFDLTVNPLGCSNFFWPELSKQVRIEGRVEKISEKESDEYFHSRPYESRLGAWASEQSGEIASRKVLEDKIIDLAKEYEGKELPRPPHWGGYILIPDYFEFWQGRLNRLHDRISYRLVNGDWEIKRLAP